jgi:GNAT superfamily N-acetyltransferase
MAVHALSEDGYDYSDDPARLDLDTILQFLRDQSYWVPGIGPRVLRRAIAGSLCCGVYREGRQVGFARVVTDHATFAYLCDVFVLPEARGAGVGKRLMRFVFDHPRLTHLRRWLLATRDAHGLYAQYGFTPLAAPERFMERYEPRAYLAGEEA